MGVTAVISPHYDDAVLSCWHLLSGAEDVSVVNVFSGVPPNGHPLGWWDRLTAASSPASRVREREAEDREALALTGRSAVGLGFFDHQHRDGGQRLEPLVAKLLEVLPSGATLAVPVDFDGHPDHALCRGAGLALRDEGFGLVLYADLPAGISYGWPAWVLGGEPDPALDVAGVWREALERAGVDGGSLTPEVHTLEEPERGRKLEALRCYRTQLAGLNPFRRLEHPDGLRYEVTWRPA